MKYNTKKGNIKVYLGEIVAVDNVLEEFSVEFLRSVDDSKKCFRFKNDDSDNVPFNAVLFDKIPCFKVDSRGR